MASVRGGSATASNPIWGDDWPQVRALWALDPAVAHLNHGSFGAVTTPVKEGQDRWRERAAANPMRYFLLDQPQGIAASRRRAAAFLGSDSDGVALLPNLSTAANTVLANLALHRGDEVLLTDQGYGGVRFAVQAAAGSAGAEVVEVAVPVRARTEEIVSRIAAGLTERTRLLVIDHITSPTARLFPVAQLVAVAHDAGVPVLVDGAHAPAQVDVNVAALGADFWAGNLHKWACAARGTAALYVAPQRRDGFRPLVTSWGYGDGFPAAFDDTGTDDLSAWLVLGDALAMLERLGLHRLREHGRALIAHGQQVVAEALGIRGEQLWADEELWMRCIPLPAGVAATETGKRALWHRISDELRCEVGITAWSGRTAIRISAHAYNSPAEYERLATGLRDLL